MLTSSDVPSAASRLLPVSPRTTAEVRPTGNTRQKHIMIDKMTIVLGTECGRLFKNFIVIPYLITT